MSVVPGDIMDKDPNMNSQFVKYSPLSKKRVTTADCQECLGCGWHQNIENSQCEKCGSHGLRLVKKDTAVYPPAKGSVAHLTRSVRSCWNESIDPESGDTTTHKLQDASRPVLNVENKEVHQEHYCKTCGAVYGWSDGRTATAEELEAGKLPPPMKERSLIMGSRSG